MSLSSLIKNSRIYKGILKFYNNRFSFESGIDITDDTQVLYRKNVVIKNIIFVSNIVFTILFFAISIGEKESTNWMLTAALGIVTLLVNSGLNKTINKNPNDYMTQTIASYIACFYMFLLSLVIYVKLKFGNTDYLQECGYILIYYSLVVCSFYQNKALLRVVIKWVLALITLLHITVTYSLIFTNYATDIHELFSTFFTSKEFKDILVRTLLLCIFTLVLYSVVSVGSYMQEERKNELAKRKQVQSDFTSVVTKIFEFSLDSTLRTEEDIANIRIGAKMAKRLAELLNYEESAALAIENFAKIHIERQVNFNLNNSNEDENFKNLKEQTELGSMIVSRLQLERKCETIVRTVYEQKPSEEFKRRMNSIQNNKQAHIVLVCDCYVLMRVAKPYKRAAGHEQVMNFLDENFKDLFDFEVYERFKRFNDEFKEIFDNYEEVVK